MIVDLFTCEHPAYLCWWLLVGVFLAALLSVAVLG